MEFKYNKICRQTKSEAYMCMYLNVMHHVGKKTAICQRPNQREIACKYIWYYLI